MKIYSGMWVEGSSIFVQMEKKAKTRNFPYQQYVNEMKDTIKDESADVTIADYSMRKDNGAIYYVLTYKITYKEASYEVRSIH